MNGGNKAAIIRAIAQIPENERESVIGQTKERYTPQMSGGDKASIITDLIIKRNDLRQGLCI